MVILRTMGECLIETGITRVTPEQSVVFAASLYLMLERRRDVQRGELAALFWPSARPAQGHHCLRQTIYRMRGQGIPVVNEGSAVRVPAELVRVDCLELLAAAAAGTVSDDLLVAAARPFLPGYDPYHSPGLAEWLDRQRDRVGATVRRLLVQEMARARKDADWPRMERLARGCLEHDPLNEEAVLALAEAMARHGSKVQALRVLDSYVAEVGTSGSKAALRLPASVLRRRIAEHAPATVADAEDAPLFGREADLAAIDPLLARAREGSGGTVLIWGEPGIGKTRLLSELCGIAALRGFTSVQTFTRWNDVHRPFAAFASLVPQLTALPGALGTSPESLRYLRRLTHPALDGALTPEAQHHEALYSRIRSAIVDLVDAVSSEVPLVIAVDDAQWLDDASADVSGVLAELVERRRVVMLLSSRECGMGPMRVIPQQAASHRLNPLSDSAASALVEYVVKHAGIPRAPTFAEWCAEHGDGNPLLLLELALRSLERDGGVRAPANLRTMLASRISQLPAQALRLLERVSLLGKHGTLGRLDSMCDSHSPDLLNGLATLEDRGMIRAVEDRISARHDLVAEVTVSAIKPALLAAHHRAIARVLNEEAEATKSVELTWEAARHWMGAGDYAAAIRLLRSCARHCLEVGAADRAVECLREAVLVAKSDSIRLAAESELISALWITGSWEEVRELSAKTVLSRTGDSAIHDDLELLHWHAAFRSGVGLTNVRNALSQCVNSSHEPAHRVEAAATLMMIADNTFDAETAHSTMNVIVPLLVAPGVKARYRHLVELVYHSSFGDPLLGVTAGLRLVNEARASEATLELVEAVRVAALAKVIAGMLSEAEQDTMWVFRESQQLGSSYCATAANQLLWIAMLKDDVEDAERWLATGIHYGQQCSVARYNLSANAAELAWRKGQAQRCADEVAAVRPQPFVSGALRAHLRTAAIRVLAADLLNDRDELITNGALIEEEHERTRRFFDQDIVTAALLISLFAQDRIAFATSIGEREARQLATRTRPLSPTLLRVLERFKFISPANPGRKLNVATLVSAKSAKT
jgi:DNA-binding SARP family transcriptional activator